MQRRMFFKWLPVLPVLPVLPGFVRGSESAGASSHSPLRMNVFTVAGLGYYEGVDWPDCAVGDGD